MKISTMHDPGLNLCPSSFFKKVMKDITRTIKVFKMNHILDNTISPTLNFLSTVTALWLS